MDIEKFIWIIKKNKYEKLFSINMNNIPYFIGNKDNYFLNFRLISKNIWYGKNEQFEIKIIILNNNEKIEHIKKIKQFNNNLNLNSDKVDLCYLFLDNKQVTNNLCVISDEDTMKNIKNFNDININRRKWWHKLKIC